MKMVKKILLGMSVAALVIGMTSCKGMFGIGDTDGTKYDLTMTVDGSKIPSTVQPTDDGRGPYRRFWEQLSGNKACAELETKVTFNTAECVTTNGVATAGLIFDLNASDDGNTVDFILIGISPAAGYYVEKYSNVPKGKAANGDTSDSALVESSNITYLDGKASNAAYHSWGTIPHAANASGNYVFTVKVEQNTPGVYTVKINNTKVSVDSKMATLTPKKTASLKKATDTAKHNYAVGGVACYGSVVKNNKLNVNYHTDKDSVLGKLEAEELDY